MERKGTFSGLALWLVPSSPTAHSTFASLISSLSNTHSTPSFAPHITLLTGIPASTPPADILAVLSTTLVSTPGSRLSLSLTNLGTHHTFFQYLFAAVSPSSPGLLALRKTVREALLPTSAGPDDYFPHVSLMYGQDTDERKVDDIIDRLRKDGDLVEGEEGRCELRGVGSTFEVGEVLLVKCEGRPDEWEVLGSVPF